MLDVTRRSSETCPHNVVDSSNIYVGNSMAIALRIALLEGLTSMRSCCPFTRSNAASSNPHATPRKCKKGAFCNCGFSSSTSTDWDVVARRQRPPVLCAKKARTCHKMSHLWGFCDTFSRLFCNDDTGTFDAFRGLLEPLGRSPLLPKKLSDHENLEKIWKFGG